MKVAEGAAAAAQRFKEAPKELKPGLISARDHMLKVLKRELPALCESDLAVVAWYCAEMADEIMGIPASDLSGRLDYSRNGYALAASRLLGWMPDAS